MTVIINGQEYAWGNIKIYLFGQQVMRARAIEYNVEQQQDYLYASGNEPHSVQLGARGYPGSVVVLQSELEAFNRTARARGYKDILGLPTDMFVEYAKDGIVTLDKIGSAYFEKYNKGQKQGDLQSEHTLPFRALSVKEGITG